MKLDGMSLSSVDTSTGECAKPNCSTGSHTLHRHHRRHEAMWLGVWASRRRGEKKFAEFVARYHAFHPDDWVRVCDRHHAEIHLIYDGIIRRDRHITLRPLSQYSWAQAEKLMGKLEGICLEWLTKETPGEDPSKVDDLRKKRRVFRVRDYLKND